MKKIFFAILFCFIAFFFLSSSVFAQIQIESGEMPPPLSQPEILEAVVEKIREEKMVQPGGSTEKQPYQKIELLVTRGSIKDERIVIENGNLAAANLRRYRVGDKVTVSFNQDYAGKDTYFITDYVRRDALFLLFLIFVALTVAIARFRGALSLLGMAASFFIIFSFILPKISAGEDPILTAIFGSLIIIPVSFFLSHGLNRKTLTAVAGTLVALVITGLLSIVFVEMTHLTGFASEEAGFLQVVKQGSMNMKGLLLAGIIIGVLGVLDDITISQSSVVFQLHSLNGNLKFKELYRRAMSVGHDHISSMVNTLILVYAGAALPLLLLFVDNPHPFSEIINYEIVADEVVRTLVGSIGLVLAVPITTVIAVWVSTKKEKNI